MSTKGTDVGTDVCDAEWDTDFYDNYQGISACCDQPLGHDGNHSGPVTMWDVDDPKLQDGMRLSWRP